MKEDKAKYDKFKINEKIEQEAEDDVTHIAEEWHKKQGNILAEQRKKHLYAKLLSANTREEKEKLERELLDLL